MRGALQDVAVLEGAGLALVGVDDDEARPRLGPHEAPFACGGEAGAAHAAQIGPLELRHHLLDAALAGAAGREPGVPAAGAICVETRIVGQDGRDGARRYRRRNRVRGRVVEVVVAYRDRRRGVAASHARRGQDAYLRPQPRRQFGQQGAAARQLAAQSVANPHRQPGRQVRFVAGDIKWA